MPEKNLFDGYARFAFERDFDLSKHSSVQIGGKAKIAFCPQSVAELCALLQKLEKDGIEYYVLGNATNVLPADEGTEKAIVRMKNLSGISLKGNAFVYAGATAGKLLSMCRQNGKSGAEFLYGIPCSIGGALFMNAGAGGVYIDGIVENVLVYRKGKTELLSARDCKYAYKRSVFMDEGGVIIGATLRLKAETEEKIMERENYFSFRRAKLPKGKSMGCVFKNPDGISAGELIEKSGLKGLRVGGACISVEHANFIINEKKATAKDVKALIAMIKNAVLAQYNVRLEEEIRYLD